jgi:hypothetical protein
MEPFAWLLSFLAIVLWAAVGGQLVRRPPSRPARPSTRIRRWLWAALWLSALPAGVWGPELWERTVTDFTRDPDAGPPMVRTDRTVRTPFAVQRLTRELDAEARVIRADERVSLQLPVGLLLFLGGVGWIRWKDGGRGGPGRRDPGSALPLLLASVALFPACGGGEGPSGADRPDRRLLDVSWEPLLHLRVEADDTLLFAADEVAADREGFWVLDRPGHRVARFSWDGALQWYAGDRGAGPGEFLNPREVDADERGRAWVLDVGTGRISGFGPDGSLVHEVPLRNLEALPTSFAVSPEGEVHPVVVDRSGAVRQGPALSIPDAEGAWGFAFQGRAVRGGEGDRWIYAFTMGDGMFRMEDLAPVGDRILYPEWIPFPRMIEEVERSGDRTVTVRRLGEPNFAAGSVAAARGRILVHFIGSTPERGRLLDLFDLETGGYEGTVLLPRMGRIGAWEDRILLLSNDPTPEILVLRMRDPE